MKTKRKRILFIFTFTCLLIAMSLSGMVIKASSNNVALLDPLSIPKFKNQLIIPPAFAPEVVKDPGTGKIISHNYTIDASEFTQQILPAPFPATKVWGYGGLVNDPQTGKSVYFRNAPGPTLNAERGIPVKVKWVNNLKGPHLYPIDRSLHWADPYNTKMQKMQPESAPMDGQNAVPMSPHLHGGENASVFDGNPDAWFTYDGKKGSAYMTSEYTYLNTQLPATLWYHDHAMGITRINVYAGLAGFYLLHDPEDMLENAAGSTRPALPTGKYDIPLAIQDRTFNSDGSFHFDSEGINPEIHPNWTPEFFGNTVMVNGKVWPNFNVERREYRFRILNGSNARFYNLIFSNNMSFTQIGSDGGYLTVPVKLKSLLLAPGERADILIDFSGVAQGTKIILKNDASAPYPNGDKADPNTVGQIMQFSVPKSSEKPVLPDKLPSRLLTMPKLKADQPDRILTLIEVMASEGPEEVLLNGQKYESPVSETPKVGSTEDWVIANLTEDAHPIHLHLVQFQIVGRQTFNAEKYKDDWIKLNGQPPFSKATKVLKPDKYLVGKIKAPAANESGWKDTVRMNPGEVTRIRVRFAPQDADQAKVKPGVNLYPFDPVEGPGYVWHCHILDHEDNEMMRPLNILP